MPSKKRRGGEGRDRKDAAAQPSTLSDLAFAEQRRRSVRSAKVGRAFRRPTDDADLRARTGGCSQAGGGGVGPDGLGGEDGRGYKSHANNGWLRGAEPSTPDRKGWTVQNRTLIQTPKIAIPSDDVQ